MRSLSEDVDGRFLRPAQRLQNTAFATFAEDGALGGVLEVLLHVRVHARVLGHLLVGLLPVAQGLLQTTGEDCQLIRTTLLVLSDRPFVLRLQFLEFDAQAGREIFQFARVALLFLAETVLKHGHVLLEGFYLESEDAFLVARVVCVSFQFLSHFFQRGFQFLVLPTEGGDTGVGLCLLFLRLSLEGGQVLLCVAEGALRFFEFGRHFLEVLLGLPGLDAVLIASAVEFVLLRFEFSLETVDGVAELGDSLGVGLTVAVQFVGEGVDASVEFLSLAGGAFLLEVEFVLEGIDFSAEGEFSLLLLGLLLLLVADEVLDLLVLLAQQPVELVDLGDEGLDLVDVAGDEVAGVLLLDVLVLDLDVDDLAAVELLEGEDLVAQGGVLALERAQFLLVAVLEGLVVGELVLELGVLVVVGGLQLADLLLQQQDLVGVVLLQRLDLDLLLRRPLLLRVLEFAFHVVAVARHQVLQLVAFLLRTQAGHFLLVSEFVALAGQQFHLLDLVLQHEFQLLDVPLVELAALQLLLLLQFQLQHQAVVLLRELTRHIRLAFLRFDGHRLESIALVSSFGEFAGELVVVLRKQAILLDEAFDLQFQLVRLAQLDLQEGDLVQQSAVLGLAPQCVLQRHLLLDQLTLDPRRRTAGVGRRLAVV